MYVYQKNSAKLSGGVVLIYEDSQLHNNHSLFIYNRATTGDVLYDVRSGLILQDILMEQFMQLKASSHFMLVLVYYMHLAFNKAIDSGGGIYLYRSIFSYLQDLCFWKHSQYLSKKERRRNTSHQLTHYMY